MSPAIVLLSVAALAVLNLVLGGVLLLNRSGSRRLAARLHPTSHGGTAVSGATGLLRRKGFGRGVAPLLASALDASPMQHLDRLVTTSAVKLTTQQICLVMIGLAALLFVVAAVKLRVLLAAPAAIIAGMLLPVFILRRIRNARFAKIAAQLPDAVDMLARSLKAGHPISTGIGMIAHEVADPIGAEFRLVHEEMTYGLDLKDALTKMGERVPIPEISYMIVAMRIQAGTGGSLAEILNSLASVIRARQNLFGKVRALSAESRFAGKILGAMPFGVVAVLLLMNPHYYDAAKTSTGLAVTLGVAAFMSVVGVLLMRKVVNIRV